MGKEHDDGWVGKVCVKCFIFVFFSCLFYFPGQFECALCLGVSKLEGVLSLAFFFLWIYRAEFSQTLRTAKK